jgi:DNA-binding transcriptional regulator LsrR (DeoR family)
MHKTKRPEWDLPLEQHEIGRFWIAWAVANGGMTQEQIAQAMGCTN